MKNIYSNIYKNSAKNLNKAKNLLMRNHIVALPTETVYGLAGNAYKKGAVKKIFNLKKRPKKNPLIIHYNNLDDLKVDAHINSIFLKLYYKFSPAKPGNPSLLKNPMRSSSRLSSSMPCLWPRTP